MHIYTLTQLYTVLEIIYWQKLIVSCWLSRGLCLQHSVFWKSVTIYPRSMPVTQSLKFYKVILVENPYSFPHLVERDTMRVNKSVLPSNTTQRSPPELKILSPMELLTNADFDFCLLAESTWNCWWCIGRQKAQLFLCVQCSYKEWLL